MSYAVESGKVGHIPTVFIEMDMDFCALRSGIGACTATQTGDDKCHNTYSTCNDPANFDKTIKTYRFCEPNASIPVGIDAIPLIKSIQFTSQEITPGKGLGVRGKVSVTFKDSPWPDTEIDPYWQERSYDTTNGGTFAGKFKARNPYYENRVLRVRRGYLTTVFDWGNFVDSVYIIDQLNGISKNDDWTVVAKDILKLADDKRALFPKPSNGVLSADISNSATSFTLSPSGIGAEYPSSGIAAISGEVVSFTRSSDVFTITRAESNTTAEAHSLGDTVQLVGVFTNEKIHDVIYEILTSYAGIDSSYIDYSAWNTEATSYLAGVWSAEITEPTGINTLLGELTEQGLCRIWWDELDQEIKFRAVKPLPEGLQTLTENEHFLAKTVDAKTDTSQRIGTVLVYFAQKKSTEKLDDLKNYSQRLATPDTDAISVSQYGTNPIKKIYSRWFKKTSLGRVIALSDSLLKTYRNPPRILEFNLTPSLQLKVGDLFYANTRKMQGLSGANVSVPMEVVYAQPTDRDDIKYKAQEVSTAIPLSNTYPIYISEDYYDLNLYDYFVSEHGIPEEGITVNFIVKSGVLICAASTAGYALTNPNTWPSDCTIKLVIESGAIIAGRGGNGGRGGRVTPLDSGGSPLASPVMTDGAAGGKGGSGILISRATSIENHGTITVGSGGGGGSGAGWGSYFGARSQSGNGGGGGWPYGLGGAAGQIVYDDSSQADFSYTNGYTCYVYSGNAGSAAGGHAGTAVQTAGGAYRLNQGSISNGWASSDAGGDGGNTLISQNSDGGGGTNAFGVGPLTTAGCDGGDAGDYYLEGDSYVTWVATGTRYGSSI